MRETIFIYSDLFTMYYVQGTEGNIMFSTNVSTHHELTANKYKLIYKGWLSLMLTSNQM